MSRQRETLNSTLCAVDDCADYPLIQHPIFLCRRHALMISINVTDVLHATALAGHDLAEADTERASLAPGHIWFEASHQPVVYFLGNGDRVKIGTSTNIAARVSALSFRKSNTLLLLQGDRELEAALHKRFEAHRVGGTEWFVLSHQIHDFIKSRQRASKAMQQPAPLADPSVRPADLEGVEPYRRPMSTDSKVMRAFRGSDGLESGPAYLHKTQIAAIIGANGSTLDNALTRLSQTGQIHRRTEGGRTIRGEYGLGPNPSEITTGE